MQVWGLEIYVNEEVRIGWCDRRIQGKAYVAGKGLGTAEAGGEIVEVVVPGLVEAGVGGGDAGDGVEGCVEGLGGC